MLKAAVFRYVIAAIHSLSLTSVSSYSQTTTTTTNAVSCYRETPKKTKTVSGDLGENAGLGVPECSAAI